MAITYRTGNVTLRRQCLIRLNADKRAELETRGEIQMRQIVEWPDPARIPNFEEAFVDPGGTDIWGPGPYLKVPNYAKSPITQAWQGITVNRVFCPWGYPPDRLRVSHKGIYLQIEAVDLMRTGETSWDWILTLKPWRGGVGHVG